MTNPPTPMPVRVRLVDGFQYVHEPLLDQESRVPFLAGAEVTESLKRRIRNSRGG